jgi:stage III sporulation protein AB
MTELTLIVKIMGIVCVCGASTLIGLYFSGLEMFRVSDLNEWKTAFLILKSEIAFASTPLPEAMEHMAARVKNPVRDMLRKFAASLERKSKDSLSLLWRQSIEAGKSRSFLAEEDFIWLYGFGHTLGYLDKSMQLSAIEMAVSYIDDKTALLEKHGEKNKKMYASLGILGGLLLSVILL